MKAKLSLIALSVAVALFSGTAPAADYTAKTRLVLGLDDCVRIALKAAPELGEAQADIDLTASKLDEAKSYRYPQIEVTSLFGPAPQAHRQDISPVFATDKSYTRLQQLTWFTSADASIIQPLFTFGKISENMKAAVHGIEVDRSRKEQRGNEIALKVREYYYGLMLAREMKELVLEVQESLIKARDKAQKLLERGSESVEELDLYKLDAFAGEVAKYLEEARKGESLALAALKTRLGLPFDAPLEISGQRLTMVEGVTPDFETFVERARANRPEFRQLSEGIKARAALVEASKANYYPDIFLGGIFSWAYAEDRDRIQNPYINDQFKHMYGGVALGIRWKLDFGITGAKVSAERAQYNRLLSTREFADANIPLQVKKYYLELKEAENSAAASKSAYTNSKKWAVTALANFDFGIGPAKEIFEALQAYARMRAAYFQSIYNYRIAWANLEYATGESPLEASKTFIPAADESPAKEAPASVDPAPETSHSQLSGNIPKETSPVLVPETSSSASVPEERQNPVSFVVARPGKSYSVVNEISFGNDYIEIQTRNQVQNYKQTKLSAPERLAIDISGAKCTIISQSALVQRFGIEKVRIGCHPDYVRIVLDFVAENIPAYEITSTARGLRVTKNRALAGNS
ncbi:MAG: TolC family protein [Deltaproteobacteria bacterium]|nr:TolC family protein [Deltaproteobacteria bacterium]